MRRAIGFLALAAVSSLATLVEAQAPTWRLGGRALYVAADAAGGPIGNTGLDLDVANGAGLELDASIVFHPRASAAIAVGGSAHDLRLQGESTACCGVDGGTVWLVPMTATVRYHVPIFGRWDPYLGVGVGWLGTYYSETDEVMAAGFDTLDFEGGAGFVAQVGVNYELGNSWYLNIDLRYLAATLEARARTDGQDQPAVDLELDPLLFGFGVGWRF
jgi:outer membrane protein